MRYGALLGFAATGQADQDEQAPANHVTSIETSIQLCYIGMPDRLIKSTFRLASVALN